METLKIYKDDYGNLYIYLPTLVLPKILGPGVERQLRHCIGLEFPEKEKVLEKHLVPGYIRLSIWFEESGPYKLNSDNTYQAGDYSIATTFDELMTPEFEAFPGRGRIKLTPEDVDSIDVRRANRLDLARQEIALKLVKWDEYIKR